MFVIKRNGEREVIQFDKITTRIKQLCYGLDMEYIDPITVSMKVINGLYMGVTTVELDTLTAEILAAMVSKHPDYGILAARIAITNLHKETKDSFSEVIKDLHDFKSGSGVPKPIISKEHCQIIQDNANLLDSTINHNNDFLYSFFGIKTLEKAYLLKINGKVVERPQYLLMRVAIGIHGRDISAALETYNIMSNKLFTHATPTLFNAATIKPQLASCFLMTFSEDSIEGIYKTIGQTAIISKNSGGIGINVHSIRAKGSYISGTNGKTSGLVPMLRVLNNVARHVDQGGNKRPGAFAVYIEPWHGDIFDVLELKKNHGKEENRARDLFYALWIPDLFMKRVEAGGQWSLMCPSTSPGLNESWGQEFEDLYEKYEKEGKFIRQIEAQSLWKAIINSQTETGTPYMLYKDACNYKSNQKNLGTIQCSNLCTEIIEYTDPNEIAVCNLASIALNQFVVQTEDGGCRYDFDKLKTVVKVVTKNLNKTIDINMYPVEESRVSNLKHRPVGIGVQGLADAFILMRLPFESPGARKLNLQIFETIYFSALEASCELAERDGPYSTYKGSPAESGLLQYDLWGVTPSADLHDWDDLKKRIKLHGLRNSLLVAPMPTASTAQILGNNESIEPYTSNLYTRRVLSGEFQVVNQHLLRDLTRLGLWNEEIKHQIIANNGSIQSVAIIPIDIKNLYKTVWEISQKTIIDMAADRGAFIDQSQSMNIHIANPTYGKLSSMHFYGWKLGLKTGMYYLRTKPAAQAIQFTVDKELLSKAKEKAKEEEEEEQEQEGAKQEQTVSVVCPLRTGADQDDNCLSCGS